MDPSSNDVAIQEIDGHQRFKADRDEARRPQTAAPSIASRIRRLEQWELVRDGRVLMRRYPTSTMRASLAFASFVAEVADAGTGPNAVDPEIVVGMSSIQVRLIAPETRSIAEPEVSFAESIDFLQP